MTGIKGNCPCFGHKQALGFQHEVFMIHRLPVLSIIALPVFACELDGGDRYAWK